MAVVHIIPLCLPVVGDSVSVGDIVMFVSDNDGDGDDDDFTDVDMAEGDSPSILCCIN